MLDKATSFDQISKLAHQTERKLLQMVQVFDVYEGENLGAGKKSYSVNFTLQDTTQTLTDTMIDELIASGFVAPARFDLGKVGTGVAVRAGVATPDVSTADGLRATLRTATRRTPSRSGPTAAVVRSARPTRSAPSTTCSSRPAPAVPT